jgi:flagellar FliL protein
MAKEKDPKEDPKPEAKAKPRGEGEAAPEAADGAPKKKRGKGLVLALVGVLALTTAGAFAFQYVVENPSTPKAEAPKPPQFVPLEPFTVNLRDDGSAEHYLQVGLTFQVSGSDVSDAIKAQMPVIRSGILLLLSSKTPGELGTVDGKAKLSKEILAVARGPLAAAEDPEKGISAVHYSAFIIQ